MALYCMAKPAVKCHNDATRMANRVDPGQAALFYLPQYLKTFTEVFPVYLTM